MNIVKRRKTQRGGFIPGIPLCVRRNEAQCRSIPTPYLDMVAAKWHTWPNKWLLIHPDPSLKRSETREISSSFSLPTPVPLSALSRGAEVFSRGMPRHQVWRARAPDDVHRHVGPPWCGSVGVTIRPLTWQLTWFNGRRYERSKDATNGAPGLTTRSKKLQVIKLN